MEPLSDNSGSKNLKTGTVAVRLQFQRSINFGNCSCPTAVPTLGQRLELQLDDCGSKNLLKTGTAVGRLRFRCSARLKTAVKQRWFQKFTEDWNRSCPTAVPTVSVELLSETVVLMGGLGAGTVVG